MILEPDERSVDSLLHHVWWTLIKSQRRRALDVARYVDPITDRRRPLVHEAPQTSDFQQALAYTGETDEDEVPIAERFPQLQITYTYHLDRATGQPQGF